jgi:glycosyltransferase involved in cell wall biosynthesis
MRVYINRMPEYGPWGGGAKFYNAAYDLLPNHDIDVIEATNTMKAPDVILAVAPEGDHTGAIGLEQAIMYRELMGPRGRKVAVVLRVNENDARKGTNHLDAAYVGISQHLDGTIFVSNWLKDYFMERGWACANNTVLLNGVDHEVFKPGDKLNNGKVNIVAHHWSDNAMKGADIYEELDTFVGEHLDTFTFTYIGRHKCKFKHTIQVPPLSGKPLGELLGKYDVYVSGSRFDPGPNHILEALACKLPTLVHKDGGGAIEFTSREAVYHDWQDLKHILENGSYTYVAGAGVGTSWEQCIEDCAKFLDATWQRVKGT